MSLGRFTETYTNLLVGKGDGVKVFFCLYEQTGKYLSALDGLAVLLVSDRPAPFFERSMDLKFAPTCIFLNLDASLYPPVIHIAVCTRLQPSDAVVRVDFAEADFDESISLGMS